MLKYMGKCFSMILVFGVLGIFFFPLWLLALSGVLMMFFYPLIKFIFGQTNWFKKLES